jgi:hypothetical protein
LFLLWKFKNCVKWLFKKIHNEIWRPRQVYKFAYLKVILLTFYITFSTGEPIWVEMTRLTSQIFFLVAFIVLLVFVINQTIDSPNVNQTIQETTAVVQSPGNFVFPFLF